jgi:hypothetical protein
LKAPAVVSTVEAYKVNFRVKLCAFECNLLALRPGMTDSKDFLTAVALGKVKISKTVAKISASR